jgi:ABC-type antimicrobial peptide transport system permease subunit
MERSTIVGVVRDVRVPGARDRRDDVQLYFPLPGAPTGATLVLRSTLPLMQLDSAVRAIARDAAAAIRVQDPVPADSHIADARAAQRSMLQLLGAFALVALLLAAIGLYAVTTYAVSQRTREIGLRVALGAQASEVVAMVIRQGLRVAIAGTIAGIAGAFVATRALEALLYGVQPTDPVTFAGVGLLLVAVAALASWPAARRAARLDPLEALRAE